MALYERYDSDGRKVERAFTVDGTDRDTELSALAEAGDGGWQHVKDAKPAARPRRKSGG